MRRRRIIIIWGKMDEDAIVVVEDDDDEEEEDNNNNNNMGAASSTHLEHLLHVPHRVRQPALHRARREQRGDPGPQALRGRGALWRGERQRKGRGNDG